MGNKRCLCGCGGKASVSESCEDRNRRLSNASQAGAFRKHEPWTIEEDATLMREDLSIQGAAKLLGRTLWACYGQRHRLKRAARAAACRAGQEFI